MPVPLRLQNVFQRPFGLYIDNIAKVKLCVIKLWRWTWISGLQMFINTFSNYTWSYRFCTPSFPHCTFLVRFRVNQVSFIKPWFVFWKDIVKQNTPGETNWAWFAAEGYQKCAIRYLSYRNLANWSCFYSHVRSDKLISQDIRKVHIASDWLLTNLGTVMGKILQHSRLIWNCLYRFRAHVDRSIFMQSKCF